MHWTTLVSAEDLAARLGQPGLVVVDCRHALSDPEAGAAAWASAHLPGAGHADLERDLSLPGGPTHEGRHPMPTAAQFSALLGRLGVRPGDQVVAYDEETGAMAAARFWWLLRLFGHDRVAVLDGGIARWRALGLPLDTSAPVPAPPYPGDFDRDAFLSSDQVQARLAEPPGWLLDARPPERFRGEVEPLDPVAGHIPGAVNRPFPANLSEGRFQPPDELLRQFHKLLRGRKPEDVVLSCGSGVTACHNLLAMEHAGLHGARIYPASWSGWVADRSRPVETGAGGEG
ncbi:sulfurtransferase [Arenimonas sp.]|uniref:sulfurtransferase n=1 Tax=Arenimonas sp. TaxID=1872635 RepID=UPI0035B4CCDE